MSTPQNTLRIDLHGMYVEDAMELLRERVARAPRGTEKIVVIHGYNRGERNLRTASFRAEPRL